MAHAGTHGRNTPSHVRSQRQVRLNPDDRPAMANAETRGTLLLSHGRCAYAPSTTRHSAAVYMCVYQSWPPFVDLQTDVPSPFRQGNIHPTPPPVSSEPSFSLCLQAFVRSHWAARKQHSVRKKDPTGKPLQVHAGTGWHSKRAAAAGSLAAPMWQACIGVDGVDEAEKHGSMHEYLVVRRSIVLVVKRQQGSSNDAQVGTVVNVTRGRTQVSVRWAQVNLAFTCARMLCILVEA